MLRNSNQKIFDYDQVKDVVRAKQLYILDTVTKLCEKYNLQYWLDAGTLLGAVRHKGYIPWDDDIDIGLMRNDYNRLIKILENELPEDLVLQTVDTDPKYGLMFAKVRDKYSYILGEIEYKYNGIFIDIFPFDYTSNSKVIQKVQKYISSFVIALRYSKTLRGKMVFIKKILKLFLNNNILYKNVFQILFFLSKINRSEEIISNGIVCPWAFYTSMRKKNVYLPTRKVYFEGKKYCAPNNYHEYLKSLYGENYMTPMKSKHNQHIGKIILYDEFYKSLQGNK